MEEMIVDARGQLCPKPLILTKQALKNRLENQLIRVLIDNETSKDNVLRFLSDNNVKASLINDNGVFTILISESPSELSHPRAESYCVTPSKTGTCIVIRSSRMGEGAEELGGILIKAFINTVKEVSPLPSTIIFYNGGIHLTTNDSPVIESLRELEKKGVKILICGTCAEYYQKKPQISVGTISNMYTIMETLASAGKILYP